MDKDSFEKSICYKFVFLIAIIFITPFLVPLIFAEDSDKISNVENHYLNINKSTNLNTEAEIELVNNTIIVVFDNFNNFNLFNNSIYNDTNYQNKIKNIDSLPNLGAAILIIKNTEDVTNLADLLEKNPYVKYVLVDRQIEVDIPRSIIIPSRISTQIIPTGIDRIDAEPTSSNIVIDADVAVLDTGIDATHPDLNVPIDKQVYFRGTGPEDECGHGTHVAGIIGAKHNDFGVVGVAPEAKIWNVKIMKLNTETNKCSPSFNSLFRGFEYIIANADSVDVANLSWRYICLGQSCANDSNINDLNVLEFLINKASQAGIVVVVSAGNDGRNAQKMVPAIFQSVITTSALSDTDGKCGGWGPLSKEWGDTNEKYRDDTLADFSNFGTIIDIAAPGVDILSTLPGGLYGEMSGTSMAAPHVTGGVALITSTHPEYSPSIIRNLILESSSSPPIECNGQGYGYFSDDNDSINEPLLYVKNFIR